MAWTTPKTWTSEPLTSTDLNTHLRDNLDALKSPPSDEYTMNESSDYSTTSTSFVDVDATNLALTIETNGGDILVHFHCEVLESVGGSRNVRFDVDLDGARIGGDDGITGTGAGQRTCVSFTRLITGLAAGSHTFKLQWKVQTSGTITLFAGAGTSNADLHPQFWIREVS